MHSKAKAPTKAERKRMERIVELGCVACRIESDRMGHGQWCVCGPPEVHHLLDGGVRRGHSATICLGAFHHRGWIVVPGALSRRQATEWFGPSLYHDARAFHERYGSDDELLAYQNHFLAESTDGQP